VKATLRWIASSVPLMVLSLILAALAWVAAVEEEDPTLERRYSQPVPVTPLELPGGMVIVGEFDERVHVTVHAPKSVWDSLKVDDFTVTVDLADLDAGVHQVPVQVTLNKQPSRVILVEPERVTLELEPEVQRTVPVQVQTKGEPTLGYLRRTATVDPSEVTVSGPSSYVARVAEAFTQVSVQDANTDIEGEFQVQLQGDESQPVRYVTWTPEVVHVRIPIEPSDYYRPLAIKVVLLEGQVAPGYRITDISVEPPTVTVFGIPDVIAALPGYIETEPIDVEGAQADIVKRPALNVPPNVAVVPGQQVEVRISIEAIPSSLTIEVTPELQGLGPGLTATVSLETVEVILSGPMPLLEALEVDDVRIVLDLFDLPRGTHQIEPQVVVPEGLIAQSIIPATVQVEIFTAPTPVPATGEG
jgi:YbbR domain-containing protein